MADPRIEKLARVLVEYSAHIQKGDRVLIESEPVAEPLIRALYEQILKAGGHPHLALNLGGQVSLSGVDTVFFEHASDAQLDYVPPFMQHAYNEFESRIRVHALPNTKALTGADPVKQARRARVLESILQAQFQRGGTGEFKWVTTLFPTQAYAQDADMSLAEYEDFVYGACHVGPNDSDPVAYWGGMQKEQQRLVDALAGHDRIQVKGPQADLTLSVKGRRFLNACGEHNMPDGEIFTGPVEQSANGWIRFEFPCVYQGNEVQGVELRLRDGRVCEAKADRNDAFLQRMLETDAGSRFLGEFAIGNNFGVQRITREILFDEKFGGTIHLALGAGYPDTGSVNKSSIHWDLICDVRRDSEITVDGAVFYKDGAFRV
jgi:aminopeptidase